MSITIEHALGYALECRNPDGSFDAEKFKRGITGVLRPDVERGFYIAYNNDPNRTQEEKNATPDPVKNGTTRKALHFEYAQDGKSSSWIKFENDMRNLTPEMVKNRMEMFTTPNQEASPLGEPSDINAFKEHNAHLDKDMYNGILFHLEQDSANDLAVRQYAMDHAKRDGFDIPLNLNDASHSVTQQIVNAYEDHYGKEAGDAKLREIANSIAQDGVLYYAGAMESELGIHVDQSWLEENVYDTIRNTMPLEIADGGYKYMQIADDVQNKIDRGAFDQFKTPDVDLGFFDHREELIDEFDSGMDLYRTLAEEEEEEREEERREEERRETIDNRFEADREENFTHGTEKIMKILLAPTYELAKEYADHNRVDATVEAEYGDKVIEGEVLTLAHHGSRSNNPAPCNDPRAVKLPDNATVLVSHLDLDTLGGLMALQGQKPDDPDFWQAAEYIDVNGPHHIHEFPQEIQDKLNAYYAFENESRQAEGRPDREHIQDVTESVNKYADGIDVVLDDKDYSHNAMIEAGRKWEQEVTRAVEDRLVSENKNVRVFSTNGPFCNGAYYSPSQEKIIPAVVSYNEKFNSITLSFADGGEEFSAREIVQSLWGPEAGGRDGIAGSPRGQEMTMGDLKEISEKVSDMIDRRNRPAQGEVSLVKGSDIELASDDDIELASDDDFER